MQILDRRFIYSASDLNNYLECDHLIALERRVARGELPRPEKSDTLALIAEKGLAHEQTFLDQLRAQYGDGVVEIASAGGSVAALEEAERKTVEAMARGAQVIYQGTFFDGTFLGKSDFLLRVERPCAKWPWSYEVADTKLAVHDKAYFIVQLSHYSEHVARVQGMVPRFMHVVRGNGQTGTFRCDGFDAYYRHLKQMFLERVPALDSYPLPVSHCSICVWSAQCNAKREADDHLSQVALMRRNNVAQLTQAGITTMAALASANGNRPTKMRESTYERLRRQASLQVHGRTTGNYYYEFLDHRPPEGFGLLPPPAPGDVYFDMEGDPFYEVGVGLEYLFGIFAPDDDPKFHAFWGTDREGEKRAFEFCIDYLMARRAEFPEMHVYHFASYEKTALRKLSQRHQTREEEVDYLLRYEVLVDLYAVVRQALVISQPSYSIKKLEPFYGLTRSAGVKKGDDSVVQFEHWLKEPEKRDILESIERYNEEDCVSTDLLHKWLLDLRLEAQAKRGVALPFRNVRKDGEPCHPEFADGCKTCEKRRKEESEQQKVSELERKLEAAERVAGAPLFAHLIAYHRREAKPQWWAYFDRTENVDQLLEFDHESLAGLTLRGDLTPYKLGERDRHFVYGYEFPDQQHRMHVGDKPHDPQTKKTAGEIIQLDEDNNFIWIKRGGTADEVAALRAIVPSGPIDTPIQKASLVRSGTELELGTFATLHPAAVDVLTNDFPRVAEHARGSKIQPDRVSAERIYHLAEALQASYLFVQGPPGTGKTYAGARVIVRLLASGKRVGVMANSHKAIHNLLHEVERVAHEQRVTVKGAHKHSDQNFGSRYDSREAHPLIDSLDDNETIENGEYNLISGNGWLFARPAMIDRLDFLVVDEAGQISLAEALAVAPCTRNLVLLGDPMQLAQVSQGVHKLGAGRSVLEHLLGSRATVAENRGVLLDTSYRMHPDICRFISESVYEGRLKAEESTANNRVASSGLTGSGLRYIPVEHDGKSRESIEEADRIVTEIAKLLQGTLARRHDPPRPFTQHDVLVVTPYNDQRKLIGKQLAAAGFTDVRVGTVDKFQGQEAPVVFYSMATSSGEDVPRTLEFLFEKNRFNVAISRAQCISVLVCSPRLLDIRCNSPEQMELANLLCRYVEEAQIVRSVPAQLRLEV